MNEEITLSTLDKGQAVILERLGNMKDDFNSKHAQNRSDIHFIRNDAQITKDEIWKLKIKIAGYAAVAGTITGAITAIVVHAVEKMFK